MPADQTTSVEVQENTIPAGAETVASETTGTNSAVPEGGQAGTLETEDSGSLLDTGGITNQADDGSDEDDASLTDWREEFTGGDDKLKNAISRYRSPKDVAKALVDAKNYIRANRRGIEMPGEDATDEEVAEFRKAMNIPESAQEYEIDWEDGGQPSETDKVILDSFADQMHKANATPKQLQAAVNWYNDKVRSMEQERLENRHNAQVETQTTLKAEWGGEYKSNLNAIKQFITSQMGGDEDAAVELFRTPLADGSMLGDNLSFIKMLATPAVDYVGPNAIYSGDSVKTIATLEERKEELLSLRSTDPNKYKSDRVQNELIGIYDKLEKLEQRG